MNSFPGGFHAIATAYSDYTKKSFEDTRSFVEKLSGVKSVDKAIEIQTEFAKSAFETFMAESQKIGGLYRDLATESYKPFGGFLAKMTRQIDKPYPSRCQRKIALLIAGLSAAESLQFDEEISCPMLIRLSKICPSIQRR
jgi:hypothetical protein